MKMAKNSLNFLMVLLEKFLIKHDINLFLLLLLRHFLMDIL